MLPARLGLYGGVRNLQVTASLLRRRDVCKGTGVRRRPITRSIKMFMNVANIAGLYLGLERNCLIFTPDRTVSLQDKERCIH